MTKLQAWNKVRKAWGKLGYIRWEPRALTEEQKAPLIAERVQLRQIANKTREQSRRARELDGLLIGCRASVGVTSSVGGIGFFHVKGQGDTFEQAFERAGVK